MIVSLHSTATMALNLSSYQDGRQIHPQLISGLIQSDGSFFVGIIKSPSLLGFVFRPQFSISMMASSLPLLLRVKAHFSGVGTIVKYDSYYQYQVSSFLDIWHIIIPHFIKHPLFGGKHLVFVKFVNIMTLLFPYFNKEKPVWVLMKVLVLMIGMNVGNNNSKVDLHRWLNKLPIVTNFNVTLITDYLHPLLTITPHFLVGLIEGDGSFYFGQRVKGFLRFGLSITTHFGELDLMYAIKFFLGVGRIKLAGTWCRFEIESTKDLLRVVVPIMDSIPMLGSKQAKYLAFRRALIMHRNKEHLTESGRKEIASLLFSRKFPSRE